ncbi:MAG: hypothetical protein Q9168_005262 [Polycauliona sp. 1 TL-2023]
MNSLRDHILTERILWDRNDALLCAFLPLLENTMVIVNAMGKQGPAQHAAMNSLADVQTSAQPLLTWDVETYEQILDGRPGNERTLKVVENSDALETGHASESSTGTLTGNEETLLDTDGEFNPGAIPGPEVAIAGGAVGSIGARTAPAASVSTTRRGKNVEVTIVIHPRDPDIRRELAKLTEHQLKHRIRLDIQPLNIRVRRPRMMTTSGDIRFKTSAADALILRDSNKYRPRNFGLDARVRTAPPESWE